MSDHTGLSIGQRIRLARERKGLTQQELAERTGHHKNSVSGWEREERTPGVEALIGLADQLGLSLDELIRDDPQTWGEVPQTDCRTQDIEELIALLKTAENAIKRLIVADTKEERMEYMELFATISRETHSRETADV